MPKRKRITNSSLVINYFATAGNLVLILILCLFIAYLVFHYYGDNGIFKDKVWNIPIYFVMTLIGYSIYFKYLFYNVKRIISYRNEVLSVNNLTLCAKEEIRFVYENLDGYNSRLNVCKCYFEQGHGIKQVRINLCALVSERESLRLFDSLIEIGIPLKVEHRLRESLVDFH
jgi:hypothetical protein